MRQEKLTASNLKCRNKIQREDKGKKKQRGKKKNIQQKQEERKDVGRGE